MNNLQSELLKKKEKLAELKQRKLERDQVTTINHNLKFML